jgi:quinol monooxygenase YgiN
MLIRVVRMYFKEENIQDFLTLFNESKDRIRNYDGCLRLDLLQDYNQEHILTTYSYWRDKKALDNYRHSAFFMENWSQMKKYFANKPVAFSCIKLEEVEGEQKTKISE